ncbi:MAG: ATP-binding protein [Planctomycetota bacterium]
MRDLSLHILDLIENSLRANATIVSLTIAEDSERDLLTVTVEDNGSGLSVSQEVATDPFYTTKSAKHTGLGLSLLRQAAERADGALTLRKSRLGGLAVEATMRLSHVDRSPLGDVAASVSSVVCTNPDLEVWCTFCAGQRQTAVKVSDVVQQCPAGQRYGLAIARQVSERIRSALEDLEIHV